MFKRTRFFSAALCCCSLAPTAWCGAPFSFDSAPGRLPKNVVPLSYDVAIVPNVDALTLTGTESVQLQFRAATATLQFNSLNETLSDVLLDGKPVKSVTSSDAKQLTTVTLTQPASGLHTLSFKYSGKIETQPQGLFAQKYTKPGGGQAVMLSTQFEATDARRMFPCWDEPAFRATFLLTVTVPTSWATVGNMPIAGRAVHGQSATVSFSAIPEDAFLPGGIHGWGLARSVRGARRHAIRCLGSRGSRTRWCGGARERRGYSGRLQRLLCAIRIRYLSSIPLRCRAGFPAPWRIGGRLPTTIEYCWSVPRAPCRTGKRFSVFKRTRWRINGLGTWSPWAGGTTPG